MSLGISAAGPTASGGSSGAPTKKRKSLNDGKGPTSDMGAGKGALELGGQLLQQKMGQKKKVEQAYMAIKEKMSGGGEEGGQQKGPGGMDQKA